LTRTIFKAPEISVEISSIIYRYDAKTAAQRFLANLTEFAFPMQQTFPKTHVKNREEVNVF